MDEPAIQTSHIQAVAKMPGPDQPLWCWPNWSCIVLLILLTLAMRTWQVCHTEVVSRDTLTYIRMAWQLEHGNVRQVLRESPHHPGYPVTIMAMSWLVRSLAGDDLVFAMQLGAQLASGLAGVLLVIPMFLLGREWFDQRICFWAALLFQCLPASARVLGDGLSEALFLLVASTSLLFGIRSLRTGSLGGLALSGFMGGLAYLVRPEGVALVGAIGLVLLLLHRNSSWRYSWSGIGLRIGLLVAPALVVAAPYMMVIGQFSAKMAAQKSVQLSALDLPLDSPDLGPLPLNLTTHPLAVWFLDSPDAPNRFFWSIRAFSGVLIRAFFYVLWVPALIGLWCFRKKFSHLPGTWVLGLANVAVAAALFRVTVVMGYVSERHLMLLILCLSFWTILGIDVIGHYLTSMVRRCQPQLTNSSWTKPERLPLLLLVILTGIPLAKSLEPLHDNRIGFRSAGYWMAQNTKPEDPFFDPFGWTYYYAGRVFQEPFVGTNQMPITPPRYVLLEETGNKHPHLSGWAMATRMIQEGHGQVVHSWDLPRGKILLYEVSLPSP